MRREGTLDARGGDVDQKLRPVRIRGHDLDADVDVPLVDVPVGERGGRGQRAVDLDQKTTRSEGIRR